MRVAVVDILRGDRGDLPGAGGEKLADGSVPPLPGDPPSPSAPPFRLIFETESSYIWSTLRRLGVHERDLEDVAHDVLVVIHRQLGDYDAARPLRPWIFGIAYRVAAGYRRLARHARETLGHDPEDLLDPAPTPDEHLATKQAHALVMAALDTLDFDRRAMIVMHDFDGHSVPEIATTLGLPLNTAYSRLRLAREQFVASCARLQHVQSQSVPRGAGPILRSPSAPASNVPPGRTPGGIR